MSGYLSVFAPCEYEAVIERSRFIARCAHCEGEEQARAFLAGVRAEHPLATHHCYAFVADKLGNVLRFSDDGEPQGTAGMPILNVLRARKLFECAVAVVRYFGGIKLGAGGLTRAYSGCAAECLDGAPLALWEECSEFFITVDYAQVNALQRFLEGRCEVRSREFAENARFAVVIRSRGEAAFSAQLADVLGGRVQISESRQEIAPFPLDK